MIQDTNASGGSFVVSSVNLNTITVATKLGIVDTITIKTDGTMSGTPMTYVTGSNGPVTVWNTPTTSTGDVIKVTITYG